MDDWDTTIGEIAFKIVKAPLSRDPGEAHGFALGDYLAARIDLVNNAGDVDATAPIHLIGHSAGGFVAVTCGMALLKQRHPANLQVTTLDTPFLRLSEMVLVRSRGGRFEQCISSVFGAAAPGVVIPTNFEEVLRQIDRESLAAGPLFALRKSQLQIRVTPVVAPDATYRVGYDAGYAPWALWDALKQHTHAHEWYQDTVHDPAGRVEGFYYSPFSPYRSHPWTSVASSPASSFAASSATGGFLTTAKHATASALVGLTGFQTFGSVIEDNGSYTLTENGNAGIYQEVTIPMNATSLRFQVEFTQAGDGDVLDVYFGNHLPLVTIPDRDAFGDGPIEIEIPITEMGGESGQLLFKLTGVGANNAIVRISDITMGTDDDADHDGLPFAQEIALGTDPRHSDTDGDGFSDAYEVNVSLTNPLLVDSDGDGQSDPAEVASGTDPMDNHSVFAVTEFFRAGGGFLLRWSALTGKTYRILRSTTPDFASFDGIASGLAGFAPTATYNDSTINTVTTPTAFYRVEAE